MTRPVGGFDGGDPAGLVVVVVVDLAQRRGHRLQVAGQIVAERGGRTVRRAYILDSTEFVVLVGGGTVVRVEDLGGPVARVVLGHRGPAQRVDDLSAVAGRVVLEGGGEFGSRGPDDVATRIGHRFEATVVVVLPGGGVAKRVHLVGTQAVRVVVIAGGLGERVDGRVEPPGVVVLPGGDGAARVGHRRLVAGLVVAVLGDPLQRVDHLCRPVGVVVPGLRHGAGRVGDRRRIPFVVVSVVGRVGRRISARGVAARPDDVMQPAAAVTLTDPWSDGDDHLAGRVPALDVPNGVGHFGQREGPVDHRPDLPGLDELRQRHQIRRALLGHQRHQPLTDEG